MARGMAVPGQSNNRTRKRMRRHRILFVAALAMLLGIGGGAAWMVRQALAIRATGSSEFNDYVRMHHIGQVEVADDASGFEPDFCVLLVPRPIPYQELTADVLAWLKVYHDLDGGRILSVRYRDPSTQHDVTQADATYDPKTQTVSLILHVNGHTTSQQFHVDWSAPASGTKGEAS